MRGSFKSALVLGAALSLASLTPALAVGGGGHGGGGMGGGGMGGGGHMGGGGMGGGHMAGAGMGGGAGRGAAGGFGLGIGGGGSPGGHVGNGAAPMAGAASFANGNMRGGSTVHGPASFAGNDHGNHGGRHRGYRGGYGYGGFGGGFGYDEGYGYSSPYDTGFYGDPSDDEPAYAQDEGVVQTGRSAARNGDTCTTPVIACGLYHQSFVGHNCSCKVPGGRSPGHVTP